MTGLIQICQVANSFKAIFPIYSAVNKSHPHQLSNHTFSSPNANLPLFTKNVEFTSGLRNLRNGKLEQSKQSQAILEPKGPKKRKAIESPQRETSINASTNGSISNSDSTRPSNAKISKLRDRTEFAISQLEQAIPEQKEAINCCLIYFEKHAAKPWKIQFKSRLINCRVRPTTS